MSKWGLSAGTVSHPTQTLILSGRVQEQQHGFPVVHGEEYDSRDGEEPSELQYGTGALQRTGLPAME